MAIDPKATYDFGPFHLDLAERVLRRNNIPIALTPKAFEVLCLLVDRHGLVLTKEEMMRQIWPDSFVDESNLAQHIFQLRKALGDNPNGDAFIETVPRRGYRFAADVKRVDSASDDRGSEGDSRTTPATYDDARGTSRRKNMWVAATALVALSACALCVYLIWRPPSHDSAGKIMLAVLPFENLTGDPQQDYFSDGLTEEMIAQLGNLEPDHLAVIARTSAMQYKDTHKDAKEIGRELGVDFIVEGSVRREGDRVRITAQLVRTKDQTHIWANSYDRSLRDVLTLQNDVSSAIAGEIRTNLAPEAGARIASTSPRDPEAYEAYLEGRYFWNKRSEAGYVKAIEYFQQAIARDPNYARAYAGLADAYALLGALPLAEIPRGEAMAKAKAAAVTALQLDGTLAEAHTSLAFVRMHYDWDWPGSRTEFEHALELDPSYATAHEWYAIWFTAQGRTDRALEQLRFAQNADPLSLVIRADTSEVLGYARRYNESKQEAQGALELDPTFMLAYISLADAQMDEKDYRAAIANLQKGLTTNDRNAWLLCRLGVAYALAGDRSQSEEILQGLLKDVKDRGDLAFNIAQIYAVLGERDQTFAWLEKAYQYREGALILLGNRAEFEAVHQDPRYADLMRRLGLPGDTAPENSALGD
jgi:TolB-like protein/DNA-binding winged helix-turn-helix (wHTH) protein/Tfp pilus assembly protein PilF